MIVVNTIHAKKSPMRTCFTILTLFVGFQLLAQQPAGPRWSSTQIGITLGGDIEMPHGLGHRYLLNTAWNPTFEGGSLPFSDGELTNMECDNPTFRFTLSLTPAANPTTVWQFSLLSIDGRIDKVRYGMKHDPDGPQFLEVSAINKETAVEVVFLKKSQAGKSLVFFAGSGTNLGFSHDGKVHVKGFLQDGAVTDEPSGGRDIDLTFNQKNSINQRLFIQAGMGVVFLKRMEAGFDLRKGIGYRATLDGPFNFTFLKRSIGLNLRYWL